MVDVGNLKTIRFERRSDGIAVITLDRPERLNAINRQLMAEGPLRHWMRWSRNPICAWS
jgi:enoyl-CoA hydratase/carnithine racemase